MCSFGVPLPSGKFYPGRKDDTPTNHDILWRAQVDLERRLTDKVVADRELAMVPWTREQELKLVEVMEHYQKLGGKAPDFDVMCNSELLHALGNRTVSQVKYMWRRFEQLQASGHPIVDKAPVHAAGTKAARTRLELMKRVADDDTKTAELERALAKETAAREAAERKAFAAGLRKAALERKLAERSRGASGGGGGSALGTPPPSPVMVARAAASVVGASSSGGRRSAARGAPK